VERAPCVEHWMPLRRLLVVGAVLAIAALLVSASAGSTNGAGPGQADGGSVRGADPEPQRTKRCLGLKGRRRAQCERMLAAGRRCRNLRTRSIRVCSKVIVFRLAADELRGRDNGTRGSALARSFLIDQLKPISKGLNSSAAGDRAYTQTFPGGTNLVSLIRGTDLADEYVVVGAHYDHLGSVCDYKRPNDVICNGATDNAAGVAVVLAIGRMIASTRPRRSVVLALWDREEDGLLGSRYYTEHPLVPLANTVAYVNYDGQGSNVLPSLRNVTLAVAAETGGSRLESIVRSAASRQPLDMNTFSSVFGQYRSDYASFLRANVPSVFFTDATGPCYHTAQDEPDIVDFGKLVKQIRIGRTVARGLANTSRPPAFVQGTPLATYDDLVRFATLLERGSVDIGRFSPADRATYLSARETTRRLVSEGRAAFGPDDVGTLLGNAASIVELLTHGPCDGFLAPPRTP
jgi:Peptidase family M28